MELTQGQISEIISKYTSSSEGFVTLQLLIMNSLMAHERELFVKANKNEERNEVFTLENKERKSLQDYEHFITFVNRWEKKYPVLRKYKAQRNIAYFTYMDFPVEVQRCIYTTNWIERLNRKYKRTIKMRAAMPSSKSVLFLLASVAMEETQTTYRRKVYQWRCWKESE